MGHFSLSPKTPEPPDPSWPGQILLRAWAESKSLLLLQGTGEAQISGFGNRGNKAFKKNNFSFNKAQHCPEEPEIRKVIDVQLLSSAKPRTCTWSRFSDYSPQSQSPNPSVTEVPTHQGAPKSIGGGKQERWKTGEVGNRRGERKGAKKLEGFMAVTEDAIKSLQSAKCQHPSGNAGRP